MFVAIALCIAVAYLLVQYAITGSSQAISSTKIAADRFFRSLAVGTGAVVVLASISQLIFLAVAAMRFRQLPAGVRDATSVRWTPDMWQLTRDSPAFVALAVVILVLGFCWEYRRTARP